MLTTHLEGEAREVGRVAAALAKDAEPGRCLILGGETTVTVRGEGLGGRNQEVALAAAIGVADWSYLAIASVATDGEDGPTDAAGAVVTGQTAVLARTHGLDPVRFLNDNDSHSFFQRLDDAVGATVEMNSHKEQDAKNASQKSIPHLIRIGPTGTNVNDLLFILTYPFAEADDMEKARVSE